MMPSNLACPHCGEAISAQAAPGTLLQCPHCRNVFPFQPGASAAQPPAYAQPVGYATPGGYGRRPQPNGAATFSMICGLVFFLLFAVNMVAGAAGGRESAILMIVVGLLSLLCPIFAIIFGIVGLAKTRNPDVTGKGKAIAGISLGGVELLLMVAGVALMLPSLAKARDGANQVKCAANLRQIGLAIQLYENENRGQLPLRPEDLILTQDITSEVFICPSSHDTMAPGATATQQAAQLSAGGHDSYIYLGKGMNSTAGARVVLVYEPMVNHKRGFNALFGDGHVEFIGPSIAQKVQAELQAGKNPPPSFR